MSTFTSAFREIVVPDLRRACRLQALAIVRERCDFMAAHVAVMRIARARGALSLADQLLADLDDWIDTTLLKTVADIETRPDAAREIVAETLGVQ